MTRNETPPDQKGGSGQWLKSNLSALGSATVFAVYAAGFIRTKAAAASLADEPVRRVQTAVLAPPSEHAAAQTPAPPAIVAPPAAAAPAAVPRKSVEKSVAAAASAPAASPTVASTPVKTAPTSQPSAAPVPAVKVPAAKVPATTVAANVAAAPVVAAPAASAPIAAPVKTPPAAPTQTPAPTPKPAPVQAPAAAVAAAVAPTDSAAPTRVGFKDGTYTGYGRSNHGDIEANVDVVDGQIVDAYITKCLTEYSCSWIVALPPQVAQRQSAEVDIVSGATASSNAFYAAVRQALSKAK